MNHWNTAGSSFKRSQFVKTSTQLLLVFAVLVSLVASAVNVSPTHASGSLTIEPLTWNVIGLDSNLVTVGPEHFPIGARVCNTSVSASTVSVTYNWTDGLNKYTGDTYINLRAGTLDVVSLSIPAGQCKDAYFEVAVTRNSSAYNKTRAYTIAANDGAGGNATTTTPRELLVEHLISQSRNSVTDMQLSLDGSSYSSVAPGGTMTLMVGQTYWIKLVGSTATNGYEQIETFINFPNTIFQVLSTNTTYTAESSATLNPPYDKLYGDGCVWENNPLSPNYRSCLSTGKAGGDITVTYQVKIISVPSTPLVNPEPLSTLIYDFSGSSYHYNADFSSSVRFARIVNASIEKSFSPKSIDVNTSPSGTSTLTFTITNPGPASISSVNFADSLPTNGASGQMSIASTTVTYTNCGGSPSPSSLTVGQTSLSFSNITVAGLGACTIAVTVTASADGTYNNDSNNLFINSTIDTNDDAKDTLVATSIPAGPTTCGTYTTLATWTITGATAPPAYDNPPGLGSGVSSASATAGMTGSGSQAIVTSQWGIRDAWLDAAVVPDPTTAPYFQFLVDSSNYGGLRIAFASELNPNGEWAAANDLYVYSSTNGTDFTQVYFGDNISKSLTSWGPITANATGVVNTWFRIIFNGRKIPQEATARALLDSITIDGCVRPQMPTLSKSFSPTSIATNVQYSTLTFSLNNPNASSLTGVAFSDTLPTGLVINDTPNISTTCSFGTAPITATAGTSTISLSASTMTSGSCTISVRVKGNVAGDYHNVSGNITSTETGPNTTSTGYGTSDLKVVDPPVIAKTFGAEYVLTNGTTSLTFTVANPNSNATLSSVAFTDSVNWPSGLEVATPNGLTGDCDDAPYNGTITATAGSSSVSLSGATLAAGASCTFTVNVKGTTTGLKDNTTGNVSHVINSATVNGNTANAKLLVRDLTPALSLKKQVSASASGPWRDSMIIAAGSDVYYKFTVENTGDIPLSSVNITDLTVNGEESCTFTDPLPVAVAANDNHIDDCIIGPISAVVGSHPNTARAHGTNISADDVDSNFDTAIYQNGNFGHLPSAYTNMNLYNDGGAFHLNGTTFFGASETTTDLDGINTPTYTFKSTDNGVTYTLGVNWFVGVNGGSLDITVACPGAPAQPCYMNAWIDWNKDNDFNDTGEQIFTNYQFDSSGTFTRTFDIPAGTVFDGSIFYSRFRLYDQLPTNPQPNGQAYNGTTPLYGEIEDPFFRVSSTGDVTTPVTLSYFKASRQGSSVNFIWSTATETGNVGFNLYVEDGGKLARVNSQMIPSHTIDSLDRQDYSYQANIDGDVYYIEDVDVFGQTRRHGPFGLGEAYGAQVEADKIDWSAIHVENKAGQNTRQDNLQPELSAAAGNPASLNLKVRQTGMYRVTYETLKTAGLDLTGVLSTRITLTNRGKAVPIYIKSVGKFGPGAYIEFYGQALDTLYTDTNVYTLQVSRTISSRIPLVNASPTRRITPIGTYAETLKVENQRAYANYAPGTDAWYDTSMLAYKTSQSWDFAFLVDGLANSSSTATLELVVWGVTDWPQTPDHHLVVSLNGVPVASQTFDGLTEQKLVVSVPAGVLQSGANTLRLTLPGDTGADWDLVNLDKFSVTYTRVLQATDGRLNFTAAGSAFKVTNLPSRDAAVYRITSAGAARLGGVQIAASGTTFTATFAGTVEPSMYLVTTAGAMYAPTLEVSRPTADLNRPAQYLIITHPNFITGIQPLVRSRQVQGLTVSVVDVNDLYAQYTYGIFDPRAIQQYITYAAQNLGTEYVLLVGGDTYDYRNYLGLNSLSFIPSLYVSTGSTVKSVPSDPLYADVNKDNIPDLAIGRFPVRTSAELDLIVNKTLAYAGKDYGRTAVYAADKSDRTVSFKNISNSLIVGLPSNWAVENIHLDDTSVTTARTQLLAAMNRGTALVTYTGHSAPIMWNYSGLFTTNDAQALTNAGRPFVAVQWGCWNNYYVDPANNFLLQKLLFSGDQGAAAVLGATTLTNSSSDLMLGQLLTPRLVRPGMSIGWAVRDAKLELALTHPELLDVLLGWSLMGDPALVIQP